MAAITQAESKQPTWQTVVVVTLAFWLGAVFLVDFVMMPSMYAAGMMTQPGFTSVGYSIFWVFNRIEILCAALALTGSLVLFNTHQIQKNQGRTAIILSLLLLAVTLVDTYALSPYMSALAMPLNLFQPVVEVPATMNQMHGSYWALEVLKLAAAGILATLFYRQQTKAI